MALKMTEKELQQMQKIHKQKQITDFPEIMDLIKAQDKVIKKLKQKVDCHEVQIPKLFVEIDALKVAFNAITKKLKEVSNANF